MSNMDLPKASNSTPATRNNWLLLAGKLTMNEYLSFDRKDLSLEQAMASLTVQYPGVHYTVSHHGKWMFIFRGAYNDNGVWAYGPPEWTSK